MSIKVKLAKYLMKLRPSKQIFNPDIFKQEYYKHEIFLSLNDEEKKKQQIEFVRKSILKAEKKPFDIWFSNIAFNNLLKDKIVLDIGSGVGGKTINCAEEWKVKKMYGVDVSEESINAMKLYISQEKNLEACYEFQSCHAEKLPFSNNTFDAIISYDTIEHVRSVKTTISECKRVVKKDGLMFFVFPSYYFPFGGAHLTPVTNTPFIQWFFDSDTLNLALEEIQSDLGKDFLWFQHQSDLEYGDWEKLKGGIGINGITYKEFNSIVNEIGFSKVEFLPIPLYSRSFISNRYKIIKHLTNAINPLLRIKLLIDYLSHRLVYILKV